jgi:hypothetical protein
VRDIVWGGLSSILVNPPNEGAGQIVRNDTVSVSITLSASESGTSTAKIRGELKIPKTGTIGGEYTESNTWEFGTTVTSSREITTERTCDVGYAIWERGYYYKKTVNATRWRYNDGMTARYLLSYAIL